MEKIIFEDRTVETPEEVLQREVFAAGQLIAGFTIQITGARPPVGIGALAYVLGMGSARVGASLDEVLAAVRQHYDGAQAAMKQEQSSPSSTPADA